MTSDPPAKCNMTIYTPTPLRHRIKSEAARRGMSMSDFVLLCVNRELDRHTEATTTTTSKEHP